MNKELKYNVGGKLVSRLEAIQYYVNLAEQYEEPEKSAFLALISSEFKNDQVMDNTKTKFQTIGVPLIGVALLLFSVYIAFLTPDPSKYQSGVFWVLLSIATAMSAVMITGNLEFNYSNIVKAGGAIAIFCIMYFYVPSVYDKTENNTTNKLTLYVVTTDSSDVEKINVDFNKNNSERVTLVAAKSLSKYVGYQIDTSEFTFYRKSDGAIYSDEICRDIQELEVFIISNKIIPKYKSKRLAFTHFVKL